tara:strand:+ start:1192 stop:1455 length:264 start_codon:yes stop_codon:yes gene_type:complete
MALNSKVDTLKFWFLPRPCRKLLEKHQAHPLEKAVAKQIPIKGNEETIEKLVQMLKLKRRFRGPRTQLTFMRDCVKADAERVSLYAR